MNVLVVILKLGGRIIMQPLMTQKKFRKVNRQQQLMADKYVAQTAANFAVQQLNCAIELMMEVSGKDRQTIVDLIKLKMKAKQGG
jgi:hypothetical protein